MFRRYRFQDSNLTQELKNEVPELDYTLQKQKIENKQKKIAEGLEEAYVDGFGYDADALQKNWFPRVKDAHVFISHSHADKDLATNLAIWLKHHFNIDAFIDSYIWGYALDLQKLIDTKHCKNDGQTTYDYDKRNFTTSHIHLMLANSLTRMLDECECLMFIESENSLVDISEGQDITSRTHTASPWVMHELSTSALLRLNPKLERSTLNVESYEMILEKAAPRNFNAFYELDLKQLPILSKNDLVGWRSNRDSKGYDALTELYNIKGDLFQVAKL